MHLQMLQSDRQQRIRTQKLENAVHPIRDDLIETPLQLLLKQYIVRPSLPEPLDFLLLPRCRKDRATMFFGQKHSPKPDTARGAVDKHRGRGRNPRGFKQRAPRRPHAHARPAKDIPSERRVGEPEAATRVADRVLRIGAIMRFATAVSPPGDAIARFESRLLARAFNDAYELLA